MEDYYRLLKVSPGALQKAIRSAYRRQAKACHPDLHPDNPEAKQRFIQLTHAYEVLSDEAARADYDRARAQPVAEFTAHSPVAQQPSEADTERRYRELRRMHSKPEPELDLSPLMLIVLKSPITYCLLVLFLMLCCLREGMESLGTHMSSR